jgi:hypothetical protein
MKRTFPAAFAASLALIFAASAVAVAGAAMPAVAPEASVRMGSGQAKAVAADQAARIAAPDAGRAASRAGGTDVSSAVTLTVPGTDSSTVTTTTTDHVWKVALTEHQKIFVQAIVADGGTNPAELFLWKPGTTTVLANDPLFDWDDLAAEAGYSATGTAMPLRLAYEVPTGAAGDYYVDVAGWGIGESFFNLSAKPGADEFTVSSPTALDWGRSFTVKGSLEPTGPGHVGTPVSVWAHWLGLDLNGVDRMTQMGQGLVSASATYSVSGLAPNSLTMPWTSYIRVEWPGDDTHGWVDETILVRVRPQIGLLRSRSSIRPRTRIRLYGKVNPGYARQRGATSPKVQVQARWGTRAFRTIATRTLTSSGWYFVYYAPATRGRWQFRTRYLPAVFANEYTGGNYARYISGYSKIVTVFAR